MDKFIVDLDHLLDNLEAQEVEQSSPEGQAASHEDTQLKYFESECKQSYRPDDGPEGIFFTQDSEALHNVSTNCSTMTDRSKLSTTVTSIDGEVSSQFSDCGDPVHVTDCDRSLEVSSGGGHEATSSEFNSDMNRSGIEIQRDNVEAIMRLFDEKPVPTASHNTTDTKSGSTINTRLRDPETSSALNGHPESVKLNYLQDATACLGATGPYLSNSHSDVCNQVNPSDVNSNLCDYAYSDHPVNNYQVEEESRPSISEIEKAVRPASLSLPASESFSDDSHLFDQVDATPAIEPERTMSDVRVGTYRPFWIPDNEALSCMLCATKFTLLKRKHHCRGCGKVLCGNCTNFKSKLIYLDREERVCAVCFRLLSAESGDEVNGALQVAAGVMTNPNPNNPSEYCSTISPLDQAQAGPSLPPPTVFVPVSVLKKTNRDDQRRGEPKQVVFSDGIRPGCDLTEDAAGGSSTNYHINHRPKSLRSLKSPPAEFPSKSDHHSKHHRSHRIVISDSIGPLYPIINNKSLAADPSLGNLFQQLKSETPVTFFMTKNLHVQLKLVVLDCCVNFPVWCFASKGLATVGQDEICVLLERTEEADDVVPRDVFRLFNNVYDSASKGLVHSEMSHILFPEGLFNCKDFSGFLFIRPTLQCMSKAVIPEAPYLVALLVQRFEVPWVKVFPLRLLLRLGHEFSCYPCPVVSYRQRKAAFCEIGHTIVNVLADFRNYQYTLPTVSGLVISRNGNNTKVSLPKNRYDSVLKVLNQNNEHVLAFGGNFNVDADSHYACLQNEEGQHQTQVMARSSVGSPEVTGASFIVFSGALKSSSGLTAKASVVEDGILVQINPHSMTKLKAALREMQNYTIECGKCNEPSDEVVSLEWDKVDSNFNIGVFSPIDGRSLEGVTSVRIHNGTDYASHKYLIRWTEVFFVENFDPGKRDDIMDPTKISGVISQSLCLALCPHLEYLVEKGMTKIGLRVTLDPEQIGYDAGSCGSVLPPELLSDLDSALVPVIMGNFVGSSLEGRLVLELFFYVILK